ncbi:unnamed protein product [Dibothriocephalus latus]|uniref:Uncharacterized protein n=1 Tax=Dibothriocephalus latus TaxID=60516 RepID=A0A3P6V6X7_DIBLA|nr:unnamed protein product [Dibothriocephalus latus]
MATQPVLEAEDANYNALVLAAACHDQLQNEDKAIDTAYLAIKVDTSNPVAWQLPDNTPSLNSLCMLTLASDTENAYALEAAIRLFIESALFSVTVDNGKQEANSGRNPTFDAFVTNLTGICRLDLHLLETYTSRLRNILVDAPPLTLTAKATVAIGEACSQILAALYGIEAEARMQQRESTAAAEEEGVAVGASESATSLEALQAVSSLLSPLLPVEGWQRQGYLDIHACALAAVTAYSLREFSRCDHIAKEIISFCRAHIMSASKEVENLNSLADSQPSTRTDFLTRRLPITPIRMEAASGVQGLYRVCDWAGCLLLANAASSTLGSLAASAVDSFSSNCLVIQFLLSF